MGGSRVCSRADQGPRTCGEGGEFPLERALQGLRALDGLDGADVGLVSYLSRIPFYLEEAACLSASIQALVSYGGKKFTSISASSSASPPTPQLLHIAGPETERRESFSVVPDADPSSPVPGIVQHFRYPTAKRDTGWALPADEDYDRKAASQAHTRSLAFLAAFLNGPKAGLSPTTRDEHRACGF